MKNTTPLKNTIPLKRAIQNLETFTNQSRFSVARHVVDFAIEEGMLVPATLSTIKRTFDRIGYVISSAFSSTARHEYDAKCRQVRNILLQNIATVRENTHLIEALQDGSAEEKKLAHSALNAIKQYNSILDTAIHDPLSFSGQLACFIHDQSVLTADKPIEAHRIQLQPSPLEQKSVQVIEEGKESREKETRSMQAFQSQQTVESIFRERLAPSSIQDAISADPALIVELDLLRAKAFSQLSKTQREIKKLINAIHDKNAPLTIEFDTHSSTSKLNLSVTIATNQTIQVVACFKRHPISNSQKKPLSELKKFDVIQTN